MATDLLFPHDAQLRAFGAEAEAGVVEIDGEGGRVVFYRTAVCATGGGQPHDTGTLEWAVRLQVVDA